MVNSASLKAYLAEEAPQHEAAHSAHPDRSDKAATSFSVSASLSLQVQPR